MTDTLAFYTLSTALLCQTWCYSVLILCYIYLGFITCYPISMIYLFVFVWQRGVQHIGMRYCTNTDVLIMALPCGHVNIATFCHEILSVSNIPAKRGSFAHCSVNVGPPSITPAQHCDRVEWIPCVTPHEKRGIHPMLFQC